MELHEVEQVQTPDAGVGAGGGLSHVNLQLLHSEQDQDHHEAQQ